MPDLPISGLPSASALAGTEPVPIVQGGFTVKTTTAAIAALATGGVTDGDKGDITVSSSGTVWTIDPTAVSNSKLANVATATFKGRTTAGTGSPEDLTVAQAKTLLNLAGTNTGDQTITLTGDVTGSGTSSFAATIPNDTVTNAKAANMATATIKGRATAGTGDPEDLTATQVKTLLAIAAGDVSGLAAIATSGSASDLSGTKPSTFITDFTEAAQDSVGVMVDSTIVYNDVTPSLGRAAITGDVTISAGSNAATIPAGTVTLAKQANLAANSIVGNNTGVAATPIALTATQTTAMLNVFTDLAKGLVPASGGGTSNFLRADGTFATPPTGGVTDGDKGDITVSSGGTVWTIDNDAVTYGQIQNVTGNSFLGRAASGAGDVGEITVGASELVGRGSTGNITAITLGTNLSMSGTTLNASGGGGISDGDKGDITVSSGGTVWTIDPTAVSNAKLANVATATFKGRTTAGTGSPEDLTVAQAKTLLDLAGTNTGDQTITLTGDVTGSGTGSFAATISNDAVTNAKAANMATATIKGRATAGTGDPEDLTATQVKTLLAIAAGDVSGLAPIATSGSAADLSGTKTNAFISDFTEASQDATGAMVDSTLVYNDATPSLGRAAITGDVTISAGSNAATIPVGTVTLAKQANLAANSIVGNNTGSPATPIALTGTQTTAMLDTFTSSAKGLVPASGGGTTTFLRADGSFATPSGSSPTTTKGDLIVRSSSADDRLPVGTNGQVLTADSAEALGVKWATPSGGGGGDIVAQLVSSEVGVTGTTTLTASAFGKMHVCSGTTSDYTVTLPAVSGNNGKIIGIRMSSALTKLVTIDGNGSETINGATSRLMWKNESAILLCDGTEWFKIAGKTVPFVAVAAPSSNRSVPNEGSGTKLDVNTVISDASGLIVNTTDNRFYVRRSASYVISTSIRYRNVSGSANRLTGGAWKTTGGSTSQWFTNAEVSGLSGSYVFASANIPRDLVAGDYLELYAYQASGTGQTAGGTGSTEDSWMSIEEKPLW